MSKFSFIKGIWGYIIAIKEILSAEKLGALLRMIPQIIKRKYKPTWYHIIIGILAVIYAISPLDFIPEITFGPIGLIDDAAILAYGIKFVNKELDKFLLWEDEQGKVIVIED